MLSKHSTDWVTASATTCYSLGSSRLHSQHWGDESSELRLLHGAVFYEDCTSVFPSVISSMWLWDHSAQRRLSSFWWYSRLELIPATQQKGAGWELLLAVLQSQARWCGHLPQWHVLFFLLSIYDTRDWVIHLTLLWIHVHLFLLVPWRNEKHMPFRQETGAH